MATVLSAGDVAIVGKRSSSPNSVSEDSFAVVALRAIDAGTVINFTDKEWFGGPNGGFVTDNVRDGVVQYTASGAIAAGTVITVNFIGSETGMSFPPSSGDQVIVFQGSESAPTLISAFQDRGDFTPSGQGENNQFNNTSELPRGLTEGVNAVGVGQQPNSPGYDNATHWSYVGPTSGSQASLLQAIHTDSNWVSSTTSTGVTFPSSFNVGAPPAPAEIDVRFGTVSIPDGDTTPSYGEGTVFGSTPVSNGTVQQTFTILNQGGVALSVNQITITGANAGDFSVTSSPSSSVPGSGSTTFTITFNPSAGGLRTATVNIANSDSNENPYNFNIAGSGSVPAASQLGAGDVAFVGFNGDATTTTFAFVLLEPVVAGTVIKFTDSGWDGNALKTGEFAAQWTAPSDLPFGTVVQFDEANPGPNFQPFSDGGYFTGGRFHLESGGDQLFAYTGSPSSPTFLAGLHTDSSQWDTSNVSSVASSQLPPQLTDGVNAISFGNGATNFYSGVYLGSRTGDQAALLAKINNEANWQGSDNPQTLPSGTFNGAATPAEIDVQYADGGVQVADGDTTPDQDEGTQFDAQGVSGDSQSHSFIIRNLGDQTLNLGQVTVTGAHPDDFSVSLGSTTVGGAQQTILTVTFNPSEFGARTATITIASNDADEPSYDFVVRGLGRDASQVLSAGDIAFAGFDSNANRSPSC